MTLRRIIAALQLSALIGLAMTIQSVCFAAPVSLYVSPDGNDAWNGRSAIRAGGDGPFATISRAQEELRSLVRDGLPAGGVTILLRAGTYELDEPLRLGPEASGSPQAPVVIRGLPGEEARLVGARKVTGFRPWRGEIMTCDLKGTPLEGKVFRQLFFRGERMTMARYPNKDPQDPHFGTWAHVLEVEGDAIRNRFTYTDDVEKNWTRVQDAQVCIHPSHDWAWSVVPVKSVDREAKVIHLGQNVAYDLRVGDRYYVQNLLEELDTPGEWYLDRETSVLYFWPPAEIGSGDVLAPVTANVVEMRDARNVTVRGLTLEACDDNAAAIHNCEDSMVAGCVIRNCGAWGVVIEGGHRSGAVGNDIYATGAGGISLTGGDRKTLERGDNFASNNYIHHVAEFRRTYNTGINVNGVGNTVDHNLVHDTYHAGIALGGNENVVEFNTVHHTNLGSADTGGIYFCSRDWTQRGNIIRYNIWHHLGGFGKANSWAPVQDGKVKFEYPHFTWGIYLDDPTTGTLVYGNILYSVPICGLHNHGGRDNTFQNNIIVDCPAFRAGRLSPNWSEWPAIKKRLADVQYPGSPYFRLYPELENYPVDRPETMTGLKFLNNIIYYTEEGSRWLRELRKSSWQGTQEMYSFAMSDEDFADNQWDNNCIYAPEGVELRVNLTRGSQNMRLNWAEWQALGKDQNSVFADPLFVDAENHDYRLKPDSPALKLGFKQIPVERIGPYQDELRASWPIVEAPGASRLGDFHTVRYFQLPGHEPVPATEHNVRGGLGNVLSKLAAGDSVRVVYFGGGIHHGWPARVADWLREQYPQAKVEYVHAGICDCSRGSGFSVFRFGHTVLEQEPDLVLVDFASDDFQTDGGAVARNLEGVVRQAWKADPNIDFLFLYAFRQSMETSYAEGLCPGSVSGAERIAAHYKIPSVNMGVRIAALEREGKLIIKASAEQEKDLQGKVVFSRDGTRPTPAAEALYLECITDALKQMQDDPKPGAHELKKPFTKDNMENAVLAPITAKMLSGEWERTEPKVGGRDFSGQMTGLWVTREPGAAITFRFKGTEASLYDLMGPDTGQVRITVDGQDRGIRAQVDPWSYYHRLAAIPVASGLADGVHTVRVELLPDPPNRAVPIEEAKKANRYNPQDFEGVALHVGWIRLRGEIVE